MQPWKFHFNVDINKNIKHNQIVSLNHRDWYVINVLHVKCIIEKLPNEVFLP